jgi:hypothetical protein
MMLLYLKPTLKTLVNMATFYHISACSLIKAILTKHIIGHGLILGITNMTFKTVEQAGHISKRLHTILAN